MELKTHPLGSFTDTDGTEWAVKLEVKPDAEPVIVLRRSGDERTERYNLHQFLSIAGRTRPFLVSGLFPGDPDYEFPAMQACEIAGQAMGRLSGRDGRYEIRWVPNDPRVPF